MGLVYMPVVFSECDFTDGCRRFFENGEKTEALNRFRRLQAGNIQAGGGDIDAADQTFCDSGF